MMCQSLLIQGLSLSLKLSLRTPQWNETKEQHGPCWEYVAFSLCTLTLPTVSASGLGLHHLLPAHQRHHPHLWFASPSENRGLSRRKKIHKRCLVQEFYSRQLSRDGADEHGTSTSQWVGDCRGWNKSLWPQLLLEMLLSTLSPWRLHFLLGANIHKWWFSLGKWGELAHIHCKRDHLVGPRILRKTLASYQQQWPWNFFTYLLPMASLIKNE